ncbi:MAG: type II secretion system minor pseudopilin GspI [Candidatus Competibacter sp.]|nr:type II secretion system minor pseudopilin GspI [Candidatus Competibacter sp.]MDG4585343.1 type II secretion system minor pseudopilin GspI [Candidatus Competibacter sp.]
MKRAIGFTLLEVLVALAVLAIAMGAVIGATTQSVNTVGALRDQTFAGWVALNKVNELLLAPTAWPNEGSRKGEAELANRVWRWEARFGKTDDPDMRRLEVTVRAGETGPILGKLVAFKGRPPEKKPDQTQPGSQIPQRAPSPAPRGAGTKP